MRSLVLASVFVVLAACTPDKPPERPTAVTNEAANHPPPRRKKPPVEEVPTSDPGPPRPGNVTEKEPEAEKCAGSGWTCVKVSFDKKTVEKRETKLLGDPKIETTWSKNTDGRPVTFDNYSKGVVEITLKRKPGDKNDMVAKLGVGKGAPEVVIDSHDGSTNDFTHVGIIAAEQDGALLVDLRYMQ